MSDAALMLAPGSVRCVRAVWIGGVALVQRQRDSVQQRDRRPRAWAAAAGPRARRRRRGSSRGSCPSRSPNPARRRRWRRAGRRPCGGACRRPDRATRSRRRTRRGTAGGRERLAGRRAVAVEPAGDPPDLGEEVGRRLELERQAVAPLELALGRPDRAEVGDGRGHDQGIEAGRAVGRVRRCAAAPRGDRPSTRPGRTSALAGRPTSTFAAMSVTRAPRSRAASAIATPILPVERLPMNRTGSIGSRVPPAVTTMWRPARSASRAGADERAGARRDRRPGSGARAIAATTASTIRGSSASRPTPDWPGGERPGLGLDDRVAEVVAQAGHVARWSPGASTCRRPSPARRRPGRGSPGRWR